MASNQSQDKSPEQKATKAYTTPRSFGGFQIPITLQSTTLRNYCEKNDLIFHLHVVENQIPNTYLVLEALVEKARIVLRPVAVGNSGFTVTANKDGSFTVVGDKPVRWVKQTDFGNAEAIGYLADRLATLGVEKELFKKGAKAKDEVRIGEGDNAVIFDWEPSIEAGAELLAGPRGGDLRLESPWAGRYVEDLVDDQLSEDEIAMQWEYNTENPKDPRIVVEANSEEK